MTSTIREEIDKLFSWNPRPLVLGPKPTKSSTATDTPVLYDKHISPDFVVKKVVRLPFLIQDLAENVDEVLEALKTLPPLEGFITAKQRADDIWHVDNVVTNEKAVADYYHQTTAKYCSFVASTLALHPSFPRWRTLLSWTQSGAFSDPDGQLLFVGEGDDQVKTERADIVGSMDGEARVIFEEVRKSMLPLAMWEIHVGSPEVMTAVHNLGEFNWTSCCVKGCNRNPNIHEKAKEWAKEAVLGPDAQTPPWNIPTENRDEESGIQPPQTPVGRVTRSAAPSGKKRKQEEEEDQHDTKRSRKDKGKQRKREDEAAYQNPHDIVAHNIVQQAWAQAVHVDGTVIILHLGNQELVCLRHRGSQTLYVSDIIVPSTCVDPGYGKLHVGIYIDAMQDMMDRRQQKPSESKHLGDKDQGPCRSTGGHGGRFQGSVGRKGDDESAFEKTINVASNRDVVFLYLRYGVYDSPVPATFIRSAPSIMAQTSLTAPFSPRALHSFGLEECSTIVITSEIGWGVTGVVHRGTLEPEICDGAMPLDIVVKLAFSREQQDALRSEYKIYCLLKSKGVHQGIATVLGIFDDSEGCALALVLLYAGVSLSESQGNLSEFDCKSTLSTLESIHGAGILHGDIRRANILIGDLGVTIIDFGHSEQCDDQGTKDKELAQLRCCLCLEGNH